MTDSRYTDALDASAEGAESSDYRIREVEARLGRRIDALESQRVRLMWLGRLLGVGLVVTLIALAVTLAAAAGDQEALMTESLIAREVLIQDVDRVTRGRMGLNDDGRAQLTLSDRDGRERIRLTILPDGSPGVTIADDEARPRAVLGYLPDGSTNLVFADAEGTSRAVLGLAPDGSTHALFADRAGAIRTLVGVDADGVPAMSLIEDEEPAGSTDAAQGS